MWLIPVHTAHDSINAATFSPDGQTLIVARTGGILQLWDVASGRERASLRIASDDYCVAFSTDGRFLTKSGSDAMLKEWDLDPSLTPGDRREFKPHPRATPQ
jgi:WD40 repeat protein